MPRLPRIYVKDAIYLITCRGEHNDQIFKDHQDYTMFLDLLKKYQQQYGIKLFAYCLLPDHLHLLVEMEKEPSGLPAAQPKPSFELSDFMRDLNNNYTKYYNGRYGRKGHLFRERFKAALVEKQNYLLKMSAYIHLNPRTVHASTDAKAYPYSSYQTYLLDDAARKEDVQFLNEAIKEAMSFLPNTTYENFVENVSEEERKAIHKKLSHGGIVGSEEFIRQVKDEVQQYQEQGIAKKYEVQDKKQYKLFLAWGSVFVVLMASASLVYVFFVNRQQIRSRITAQNGQPALGQEQALPVDWRVKEWRIKLTPIRGGTSSLDILTFKENVFISSKLTALGFPNSNFSQSVDEDGAVIWRSMQNGSRGVATWKGQVNGSIMKGILSLREEGKPAQDFSFVSE